MKVGLIGNQNSGKTTLFNYLTGMNAKIGNWPGVTIEKKTGKIKGTEHEITDLPGIYSLSPYTTEEEVSRNYVFEENPDLIINIVDATSLERSLYLTTQLLELNCKVLVALNMADILEKKGLKIDVDKLSKELGTKVVQISALKETGMDDLLKAIDEDFTTLNKEIYDIILKRLDNLQEKGYFVYLINNDFFINVPKNFREDLVSRSTLLGLIVLPQKFVSKGHIGKSIIIGKKEILKDYQMSVITINDDLSENNMEIVMNKINKMFE